MCIICCNDFLLFVISQDTEFPGVVARPVTDTGDMQYQVSIFSVILSEMLILFLFVLDVEMQCRSVKVNSVGDNFDRRRGQLGGWLYMLAI